MHPSIRRPPAGACLGALLPVVLVLGSCRRGPVDPALPILDVVVAGGDGQFGTLGQTLPEQLHAVVRVAETGLPRKDVTVLWEVEQGSATFLGVPTTVTDSTGSSRRSLQIGTEPGEILVRVSVIEQQAASAEFVLHAVEAPELLSLSTASAAAGDTITLTGANFSPVALQDVVLFSGIRGRVLTASGAALEVEVPRCLGAREVDVTMQLGSVATGGLPLTVTGGTETAASLQPGDVVDVDDADGLTCLRLPGGASYLALVTSGSTVGAASHEYVWTGLVDSGSIIGPLGPAGVQRRELTDTSGPHPQALLDGRLRLEEKRLLASSAPGSVPGGGGPSAAPAPVPVLGEKRTFKVLNSTGGFDDVTAVARHVGTHGVLYVDESAPAGGLTDADLADFAARFDGVIHATVTQLYGSPSDLDGNQRVVVLFTPVVNRFTPRGSSGFVGGFFFGLDLLPDRANSNGGEIFYALVPDEDAQFSDARTKDQVLAVVPAILAHEFQHMVHFNERVLERGAASTEALWLSEGLATMAEESVARAYQAVGDAASVELFRSGNLQRARKYLANPAASLIVTTGQGSLEERGAGWLHVLYLAHRFGDAILGELTRTTLTGTSNVTQHTGVAWDDLTADWWSALYLDGIGPEDGRLEYPDLDLRSLVGTPEYPLVPERVGVSDFEIARPLWSSSADYFELVPPSGGAVSLRLGGPAGGSPSAEGVLRLRIVRLP